MDGAADSVVGAFVVYLVGWSKLVSVSASERHLVGVVGGISAGFMLGLFVGELVGLNDGDSVGLIEALLLGDADGHFVGNGDDRCVGVLVCDAV